MNHEKIQQSFEKRKYKLETDSNFSFQQPESCEKIVPGQTMYEFNLYFVTDPNKEETECKINSI